MPQFFFNVAFENSTCTDEVGAEFLSIDDAIAEAEEAAAEMLADALRRGSRIQNGTITVCDMHRAIADINFGGSIIRSPLPPKSRTPEI